MRQDEEIKNHIFEDVDYGVGMRALRLYQGKLMDVEEFKD